MNASAFAKDLCRSFWLTVPPRGSGSPGSSSGIAVGASDHRSKCSAWLDYIRLWSVLDLDPVAATLRALLRWATGFLLDRAHLQTCVSRESGFRCVLSSEESLNGSQIPHYLGDSGLKEIEGCDGSRLKSIKHPGPRFLLCRVPFSPSGPRLLSSLISHLLPLLRLLVFSWFSPWQTIIKTCLATDPLDKHLCSFLLIYIRQDQFVGLTGTREVRMHLSGCRTYRIRNKPGSRASHRSSNANTGPHLILRPVP